MMDTDVDTWENALVEEMRANDGPPASGPLAGHPILVMHNHGAKTGTPRRALLTYSRDGDDYIVAGTAGGSRTDPAWLANVRANPNVVVDIGRRSFQATAVVVDEDARQRLWDQHVAQLPWFAEYPEQTGRAIPMVRIRPTRP